MAEAVRPSQQSGAVAPPPAEPAAAPAAESAAAPAAEKPQPVEPWNKEPPAPAPAQVVMGSCDELGDEVLIKQTKKGCIQELMGCEAKNEFLIYKSLDSQRDGQPEIMYSLEESGFCVRCCCQNNRPFTQTIWKGTKDAHTEVFLDMKKDWAFPLSPGYGPCFCGLIPALNKPPFIQSIKMGDIGSVEIPCFCCIANLKIKDETGKVQYQMQQPSCMGGMCVNCFAEGCCNCKVPFYMFEPDVVKCEVGKEVGKVVKLWRGIGTEIFTDAASFQVTFPPGLDDVSKKRIIGSVFMVNMQFFESSRND
jgi:hypothetical protein